MRWRAPGDRREHDFRGRHREIGPVVLADTEGVDAERVGEDALLDHVADDFRLRQQAAVRPEGDVAECIEAELKLLCHLMWDRPRRIRSLWQPIYCHSLRNPAVVPVLPSRKR